MMFHKLGLVNKSQKGFTMMELLVAFAITGIISSGITMTLYQVVTGSARISNHMVAVKQAQNAGYWFSHDAQAAQSVNLGQSSGLPLTLGWIDWNDTENTVTYTLEGTELWRDYKNGQQKQQSLVARCVESIEVSPRPDGAFTLTITVSVGAGSPVTRVYQIVPRALVRR